MLIVLLLTLAPAAHELCEPMPDVAEVLERAAVVMDVEFENRTKVAPKALAIVEQALAKQPRDLFLLSAQLRYRMWAADDEDLILQQYLQRHASAPTDGVMAYLYAGALLWKQDKQRYAKAKSVLEQLMLRQPIIPRAHLSLVNVHLNGPDLDLAAARQQLLAYQFLCPESLEGLYHAPRILPPKEQAAQAKRARKLLEDKSATAVLDVIGQVWTLEFASAPAARHKTMRKRVQKDLRKLREEIAEPGYGQLQELEQGYRLSEDKAGLAWVEAERERRFPSSRKQMFKAVEAWSETHPYPAPDASVADRQSFHRARVAAARDWMQRWPEALYVWTVYLDSLVALPESASADVDVAARRVIALSDNGQGEDGWDSVVRAYYARGLHLPKLPELVDKAVAAAVANYQRFSSMGVTLPPDVLASMRAQQDRIFFEGSFYVVASACRRGKLHDAQARLDQMNKKLPQPDPSARGQALHSQRVWTTLTSLAQAEMAQARRNSIDAIGYLVAATASAPSPWGFDHIAAPRTQLDALWRKAGGTEAALLALLTRVNTTETDATQEKWTADTTPMPTLDLPDLRGKRWRSTALKGKTVVINLWASWCDPCVEELPAFEKLRKRYKKHKDVVFLTLNADSNPGVIAPVVKQTKLRAPVIWAQGFIMRNLGMSLPQTLVIDADGVIRRRCSGYGGDEQEWLDLAAKAIEAVREG